MGTVSDSVNFEDFVVFVKKYKNLWTRIDGSFLQVCDSVNVHAVTGLNPSIKFHKVEHNYNYILEEKDKNAIYGSNVRYSVHHKDGYLLHVWYEDIDTMYFQ